MSKEFDMDYKILERRVLSVVDDGAVAEDFQIESIRRTINRLKRSAPSMDSLGKLEYLSMRLNKYEVEDFSFST